MAHLLGCGLGEGLLDGGIEGLGGFFAAVADEGIFNSAIAADDQGGGDAADEVVLEHVALFIHEHGEAYLLSVRNFSTVGLSSLISVAQTTRPLPARSLSALTF